jgi:hypothetical protein
MEEAVGDTFHFLKQIPVKTPGKLQELQAVENKDDKNF